MRHNAHLDNLRGYAALMVVLTHFSGIPNHIILKHKWLVLYNYVTCGHQAVILFFVLSGYVLTPSVERANFSYFKFIIKRVFRIYPAYFLSVIMILFIFNFASDAAITRFRGMYASTPLHFNSSFWVNTISLISSIITPYYEQSSFSAVQIGFPLNLPTWSLTLEMLISFFFPLLVIVYNKNNVYIFFVLALQLVLSIIYVHMLNNPITNMIYYSIFFAYGVILYKNRQMLCHKIKTNKWIFIGFALFLYSAGPTVKFLNYNNFVNENITALGGMILIILCNSNAAFQNLIDRFSIFNLGKTSYSIYLLHIPISCFVFSLFIDVLHFKEVSGVISVLQKLTALVLLFAVCNLTYKYIESPFIKLSKRLTTSN